MPPPPELEYSSGGRAQPDRPYKNLVRRASTPAALLELGRLRSAQRAVAELTLPAEKSIAHSLMARGPCSPFPPSLVLHSCPTTRMCACLLSSSLGPAHDRRILSVVEHFRRLRFSRAILRVTAGIMRGHVPCASAEDVAVSHIYLVAVGLDPHPQPCRSASKIPCPRPWRCGFGSLNSRMMVTPRALCDKPLSSWLRFGGLVRLPYGKEPLMFPMPMYPALPRYPRCTRRAPDGGPRRCANRARRKCGRNAIFCGVWLQRTRGRTEKNREGQTDVPRGGIEPSPIQLKVHHFLNTTFQCTYQLTRRLLGVAVRCESVPP